MKAWLFLCSLAPVFLVVQESRKAEYEVSEMTRDQEFTKRYLQALNGGLNKQRNEERGTRNKVDSRLPYAFHCEPEYSANGKVDQVATIFLTNKECPFNCLMCDLWRNTLEESVAPGDIPAQIDYALARLPAVLHIKLYNSGNFFDPQAIPRSDYPAIAGRLDAFERVIVENHPRLCNDQVLRFNELIGGRLEVAMGLETAHPEILERLNKKMTLEDFEQAASFLTSNDIPVRAFILLRPPFMTEEEGVDWAIRSMEFAFDVGVECCSIVPTRAGTAAMDRLVTEGHFAPPSIDSMVEVQEAGLRMQRGRVFMDLWDIDRFYDDQSGPAHAERIRQMNLTQKISD